jgi:hypothetical protein
MQIDLANGAVQERVIDNAVRFVRGGLAAAQESGSQ